MAIGVTVYGFIINGLSFFTILPILFFPDFYNKLEKLPRSKK
jgi:hypothetical protein